jgi:IS30 family transposase
MDFMRSLTPEKVAAVESFNRSESRFRHWTKPEVREMLRLRKLGVSIAQIGRDMDRPPSSVSAKLRECEKKSEKSLGLSPKATKDGGAL